MFEKRYYVTESKNMKAVWENGIKGGMGTGEVASTAAAPASSAPASNDVTRRVTSRIDRPSSRPALPAAQNDW